MEELQDWLADARYSASLVEGSHKPIKLLPLPPPDQVIEDFINKLDLSHAGILSQPLGVYFMSCFIDDTCPQERWVHDIATVTIKIMGEDGDLVSHLESLLDRVTKCSETWMLEGTQPGVPQDILDSFMQSAKIALSKQLTDQPSMYSANNLGQGEKTGADQDASAVAANESSLDASVDFSSIVRPLHDAVMSLYVIDTEGSLFSRFLKTAGKLGSRAIAQYERAPQRQSERAGTQIARLSSLSIANSLPPPTGRSSKLYGGEISSRTKKYLKSESIVVDGKKTAAQIAWLDKFIETLCWSMSPLKREDFAIFRDIGRGAFGLVSAATCVYTGKMFALKAMNRKLIKGKKASKLVKQEFKILQVLVEKPSRFVVSLQYSFVDLDCVYFCLNLLSGGDLRFHLDETRGFTHMQTRFFTGQIALGLAHLHSLDIIYRDLKPENIMLDERGNAVITDMGLSQQVPRGKPYLKHRAGTSGYWAPEVISQKPYTFSADWWSLGSTSYELVRGTCPFSKRITGRKTRDEGILSDDPIKFDEKHFSGDPLSESLVEMLTGLLERDPDKRISSISDLKKCKFFSAHNGIPSLNWDRLRYGTIEPLYKPEKDGAINAENAQDIGHASMLKTASYRNLDTSDETFPGLTSVANVPHQEDIASILEMERKGELDNLFKKSSGCCVCS